MTDLYCHPTHTDETLLADPSKSPFGYYGAKLRLAKQIIESLPPHNAWVEGFCGSAAITLGKPAVPIEVINDIDGQVVNLFTQLRTNSDALCRMIELTPYSRAEFELARQETTVEDKLESARRFLIATMMTVNATIGDPARCGFSFSSSYTRGGKEARVNRWYNLPERIAHVVERLRGVRVEQRDACDIVAMFEDRPATLMYLDPPYFIKRDHRYVIEANDREFHEKLLTACKKAKCMILLSHYENELYSELLTEKDGWTTRTIETHTRDTSGVDSVRTEILWMNARFNEAAKSGELPLKLTDKEIEENKVNPAR